MTYLEIASRCRQAAAIVQQGWLQRSLAERSDGTVCKPTDPEAAAFCLLGALQATYVLYDEAGQFNMEAYSLATARVDLIGLVDWNNAPERTQAEVVAKLHEIADAALTKAVEVGEVGEPPVVVIQPTRDTVMA